MLNDSFTLPCGSNLVQNGSRGPLRKTSGGQASFSDPFSPSLGSPWKPPGVLPAALGRSWSSWAARWASWVDPGTSRAALWVTFRAVQGVLSIAHGVMENARFILVLTTVRPLYTYFEAKGSQNLSNIVSEAVSGKPGSLGAGSFETLGLGGQGGMPGFQGGNFATCGARREITEGSA